MDFSDIKEVIERWLPLYFKAKGIKYKLTYPKKEHIKVTANLDGKNYVIEGRRIK